MFDRFNEDAIRVIMLAQEEVRRLRQGEIGTAFLLLGLIGEGKGIAAKALKSMEVNLANARHQVESLVERGVEPTSIEIPFSENAKSILKQSLEEAQRLGYTKIGTEHLLLAIASLKQGIAYQVLTHLRVDLDQLQTSVLTAMNEVEIAAYDFRTVPNRDLRELAYELDELINQLTETLAIAKSKSELLKHRIRSRSLLHSEATNAIGKLPATSEGIAVQQTLTELQTTIETDADLTEEDKAEVLSQIQGLARFWQIRQEARVQQVIRQSMRILRGTIVGLPPDAPQLPTYQRMIAELIEYFQPVP